MKFHSFSLPTAHLLLSGPVPTGPWPPGLETLVLYHLRLPYKSQKFCCDLFLHSFCLLCLFTLICIISVDLSLSPPIPFCFVQSSFIPMGYVVLVTQFCPTLCNPWTVAHKATLSMGSWDSAGKNTQVGFHFLLQGIFPTQGSNPGLLHCRQILYCLNHQGSPIYSFQ